jgi:heat shock protein HtpX
MGNNLKTVFWMAVLSAGLVTVGHLVAGSTGTVIAFVLALMMNGAAYWLSDRFALAMAGAREVSPTEAPELHRLVGNLALWFQVPKPRVYLSPQPSANAFATGRNPQDAAICVTEGLLNVLTERELRGVLAHEFAHIRNRDILIGSVVAVLAGAITMLTDLPQWPLWFGSPQRQDRLGNPLGPLGLLLGLLLAPLAASLVQLAVSRSREFEADRTGAQVSGPRSLASALTKLEQAKRVLAADPVRPAFAHLYIVSPLSEKTLARLFSTHPSVEKRVQRLQEMAGRAPVSTSYLSSSWS